MSDQHLAYIQQYWGGLPAFCETYVALDRQLRQQLGAQGDVDSLLIHLQASTEGVVGKATQEIFDRLAALEDHVSERFDLSTIQQLRDIMPGGPGFDNAFKTVLDNQMHGLTDATGEQFLHALGEKLKTTDNNNIMCRFDSLIQGIANNNAEVSSFRLDVDRVKQQLEQHGRSIQSLYKPVEEIHKQVLIHKVGRGVNIGLKAEEQFLYQLRQTCPSYEVDQTSKDSNSADFKMTKDGRPDILFELKDHAKNVPGDHVNRAESDARHMRRHTIVVSMRSGVANRKDFEFRVKDNRYVVLFMWNVNWDMTRIKAAVNLIYSLEDVLTSGDADGNLAFKPEVIQAISDDLLAHERRVTEAIKLINQARNELSGFMFESIKTKLASATRIEKLHPDQCPYCKLRRDSFVKTGNLNSHLNGCHAYQAHLQKQNMPQTEIVKPVKKTKREDKSKKRHNDPELSLAEQIILDEAMESGCTDAELDVARQMIDSGP